MALGPGVGPTEFDLGIMKPRKATFLSGSQVARYFRPRSGGRPGFIRVLFAAVGLLQAAAPTPAPAQNDAKQQPQTPPGADVPSTVTTPTFPPVTVEAVDELLKRLNENPQMEAPLRAEIKTLYEEAKAFLQAEKDWAGKAAENEQLATTAPEELTQVKTLLSQPEAVPQVEIPTDATLEQLDLNLAQANQALEAAKTKLKKLEESLTMRDQREKQISAEQIQIQQDVQQVELDLQKPPSEGKSAEWIAAVNLKWRARRQALLAQKTALEKEQARYVARRELTPLQRDLAAREVDSKDAIVKQWQTLVNQRRQAAAEEQIRKAKEAQREAARTHPLAKEAADRVAKLAEMQKDLASARKKVGEQLQARGDRLAELEEQFRSIKVRFERGGLTAALGTRLSRLREGLENPLVYRMSVLARERLIVDQEIRGDELEATGKNLKDVSSLAAGLVANLRPEIGEEQRSTIEQVLKDLLTAERDAAYRVKEEAKQYGLKLSELSDKESKLYELLVKYKAFLDENVLWVRSGSWPDRQDLRATLDAGKWLFNPASWQDFSHRALDAFKENPAVHAPPLVAVLLFLVAGPLLRKRLRDYSRQASRGYQLSYAPTIRAALCTLVLALRWPTAAFYLSWICSKLDWEAPFAAGLRVGFLHLAVAGALFQLVRETLCKDGLAIAHFLWPEKAALRLRRLLLLLTVPMLPLIFITVALDRSEVDAFKDSLGRWCLIAAQLLLVGLTWWMMRPGKGPLRLIVAQNTNLWSRNLRVFWHPAFLVVPLFFIALALAGYHYSALRLATRFSYSMGLLAVLVWIHQIILRWILISRRRLALEQAKQRRDAAKAAQALAEEAGAPAPPEEIKEPRINIEDISDQTRKLLRAALTFSLFMGFLLIWSEQFPALRMLDQVELWTTSALDGAAPPVTAVSSLPAGATGDVPSPEPRGPLLAGPRVITLKSLLLAIIVGMTTWVLLRNLPGLLEIAVLQKLPITAAERYALTTVTRYVVFVVGLFFALNFVGIGWSHYQWLLAAVGLGLGFGLQEIFANFVSGLIILFEQPIRIGDIVNVDGLEGRVTSIRTRATLITDWDRKVLIIPNKTLVTSKLINWTLSESPTRIVVPIGVAYGSDTDLAKCLLLQCARACAYVAEDPAPQALFLGFGDSALKLELRVFISNRDFSIELTHELYTRIDRAFREAGIEIAFPQLDLHIRSAPGLEKWASNEKGGSAPDLGSAPSSGGDDAGRRRSKED